MGLRLMKTLGVTGGIGSGKTTVCGIFKELGAWIFSADDEAKRLMLEADVRREIIDAFGTESYDSEGNLNRKYLAETVFHDDDAIRRINGIVHPRVFQSFERMRTKAEDEGAPLLVHEAAILYESGGDKHVDAVAVVDAPEEVRIRRVMERDGSTEAAVRARIENQWPAEELRTRADFVIQNDGEESALLAQVERVFEQMTT